MKQNLKTTAIILLLTAISAMMVWIIHLHFKAIEERSKMLQNQQEMKANQELILQKLDNENHGIHH